MQPYGFGPMANMAQRQRDYTRQRNYGTGDILLDNRIIFFGCSGSNVYEPVITDVTANMVIQQMLYLQNENKQTEISFYINWLGFFDPCYLRHHAMFGMPDSHLLHGSCSERRSYPAGCRHQRQALLPSPR